VLLDRRDPIVLPDRVGSMLPTDKRPRRGRVVGRHR
jgi:hypothetical protein